MAMMPSAATSSPYNDAAGDHSVFDDDFLDDDIEPDIPTTESDRTPLTGSIQSQPSSSQRPLNQNYLTSQIPGEDRRAIQSTIDESVWDTVSRDLSAVWEKMRQVLWPKYLLGGMLSRSNDMETGTGDGGTQGFGRDLRGLVGRWPAVVDADGILHGSMSEGLRDWDLWGPLIFCLLLSLFLSMRASSDQKDLVFSGVFSLIWLGEAVVAMQIKLLGGNISLMQSISILGYTIFPLVIASLLSAVGIPMIVRIPVYIVLVAWSLAAGVSILGGSGVVKNRVALAIYPMFLFYVALGCLCFIS